VHEIPGRVVFRKGVAELLCGPGRDWMFGDRHVNDPSTVVREDDQDEQQPPNVTVGTTNRSAAIIWLAWLVRNVRHVCDGR
jgi:hypothetical protein